MKLFQENEYFRRFSISNLKTSKGGQSPRLMKLKEINNPKMSYMRLLVPTHKCDSPYSSQSTCRFCTVCGVFMSKAKAGPTYYRSEQYKLIDVYKMDFHSILTQMIRKQNVGRHYNPQAKYIKSRKELLDFVEYLAEKLEFSQCTYHLAIGVLDALLTQFAVDRSQIKLVCFMSLQVAAKMEEHNEKVPEVQTIRKLFQNKFDNEDINTCEIMIAKSLNYNFNLKTPFAFIEYFFSKGVVSDFDIGRVYTKLASDKLGCFERAVMRFLDISTLDYDFYAFDPITIAAACILCARRLEKYDVLWPEDLVRLIGLTYEQIRECADLMYCQFKLINAKQSSDRIKHKTERVKSESTNLKKHSSVDTIDTSIHEKTPQSKVVVAELIVFDTDEDEPTKNPAKYVPNTTQF